MKKKNGTLRIGKYLLVGTVLSVLVFLSISFLSYLVDLDTFNPSASKELDVDIGIPFTFYAEEFREGSTIPKTWANKLSLLTDSVLTWIFIALPYFFYKMRKDKVKLNEPKIDILDQQVT